MIILPLSENEKKGECGDGKEWVTSWNHGDGRIEVDVKPQDLMYKTMG